ncbi:MAG: hypothetical protein ACO201_05905 [Rickettsiales bacterium]
MKPTILSFYRLIEDFDGTKEKLDEINQLLDEHPKFINFTRNDQPLLHFACQVKKPEIAKILI